MCGIAGIFRGDGAVAGPEAVAQMLDAMPHRGPDGRATWADGPVALGHTRLAVRDLGPAAAQPMRAPDGAGVLVYNGEVYNDGALRRELAREGVAFRSTGDTEVLLHALARWGPQATVGRLDGMFAFAWWDARERALWLARDRFGIKPVHVASGGGGLLFASEVRALRTQEGVGVRPDLHELARRLVPWRVHEAKPPFDGVESVPPGGLWRVTAAGVERRLWFDLLRDVDVERIVQASREPPRACADRVGAALEAAVRSHLASDVPLATFLSGGVDSGLVTALAKREVPHLHAYTIDSGCPESEAPMAARTARHLGVELRPVRVGRAEHLRLWADSIQALEHPSTHANTPEALALTRAARADGVVVVLTGEGSDELLGGYSFFEKTWKRWRDARSPWRRLGGSARRGGWGPKQMAEVPFAYQSGRRDLKLHCRLEAALAPAEEHEARALLRRLAAVEPPEDRAFLAHGLDALHRHLLRILLHHDRFGMAASIEMRVPFLGTAVSDVGLHLPRRAKFHRGQGKWALRQVAARWLPREIAFGEKRGFPVPNGHHAGVTALLRGGRVPDLFGWSRDSTEDLLPRIERDMTMRYQFASLEMWLRIFFHGERPDTVAERLVATVGPS
jgi:asparagine synthase (glutamine-hydrolysing)